MNCPVCDRSLAPTLSICPSCGAMMNDTVREELQTKITQGVPVRIEPPDAPTPERRPLPPRPAMITPLAAARPQTAGLVAPKTSPTLVGFQSKNTSVPDWRLQMQNAVQQRRIGSSADAGHHFPSNGGAALKAEPARSPDVMPEIVDSRVANAMRRIDESRKTFLETTDESKKVFGTKPQGRPFGVVAPNRSAATGFEPPRMPTAPKPRLVVPVLQPAREKRDTNKLPPIEMAIAAPSEIKLPIEPIPETPLRGSEFGEIKRIRIKAEGELSSIARPMAAMLTRSRILLLSQCDLAPVFLI